MKFILGFILVVVLVGSCSEKPKCEMPNRMFGHTVEEFTREELEYRECMRESNN
jgi:hypothetical protein